MEGIGITAPETCSIFSTGGIYGDAVLVNHRIAEEVCIFADVLTPPYWKRVFLLEATCPCVKSVNPSLRIDGILLTMFDVRNNISHQVKEEVCAHFGSRVFSTVINRNVRLSEAPSFGKNIFEYDNRSTGAAGYRLLAEEFLDKGGA